MAKTKNKKKVTSEYVSLKKGKANAKKTLNPFEVHINKEKLKVLGKKQKNDKGLPGVSRAKAIKKRKSTLLHEYKLQNKSNKFLDKRIGEKNFGMSEEDRTMARFTAVRLKENKKKSIFNLADDEVLTHRGQTLTEIEKFDDPRSDDEDSLDGKGNLESDFVEEAHFGGGLLKKTGIEGAKSHKDIIEQLIAESKKRKAEQQKNKEATLELTEKLDSEWKDLGSLVHRPGKSEKEPDPPQNTTKTDVDDYDKIMRELRFEARGTVSDRLKTQDEIAVEEKEKLEQLEKERLERMKGNITEKSVTNNHRSADDLDDDIVYENDPDYMLSYNQEGESNVIVEAEVEKINEGNSEENKKIDSDENRDDDENDAEESGNEEVETGSEDNLSDLKDTESESEDEIEEDKNVENDDEKTGDKFEEVAPTDLPYTFSIPDSYEGLQTLLENHTEKEQSIIIERMIKCNHPSLAEGNKDKLGLLFAYLLQYINDLFSDCNDKVALKKHFQILNSITVQIYDLAKLNPENVYISMLEVIKEKHEEFKKNFKKYPGLEVMIFFQLIDILFTTSDFRHQIVTPSFIFMEQMLNKCKVKNKRDISFGLFLVTLILNYTLLSKRFLPASINFLCGLLHSAIPKGGVKLIKVLPPFKSISTLLVLLEDHSTNVSPSLKMDVSDLIDNKIDEEYKIRALSTTLELLKSLFNQYKNYSSSFEIFQPALKYIESIPIKKYPKKVADSCNEFVNLVNESRTKRLQYLVQESSKPKALRLYEPKIMDVYDGKRHKMQSKEKAERAKLLYKVKQERKGALREIRRDNAFLARVKIQQQVQSDKDRREKVKRLYAEAASQQSELNALDRKKKIKK